MNWEWWHNESGQCYADINFIPIKPEADRFVDSLFSFLKSDCLDVVEVVDSCNGLLLCCIYTGICEDYGMTMFKTTWFVCNPLTKKHVILPYPKRSTLVYYGLLADTTNFGYLQFKIVCIFSSKDDDYCSMLSVFSSETGEWKELEERLPPLCHYSVMGSKLVCNGSLFWDCLEGHILVFHLNKKSKSQNCYELIEAPRAPLGRSLWKSSDKLFCYCHGFNDEFPVWSLSISDEEEIEWKVEGCKEFEMLTEDVSNGVANSLTNIRVQKPRVKFNVIGFNPESNVIYAWKTGASAATLVQLRLQHSAADSAPRQHQHVAGASAATLMQLRLQHSAADSAPGQRQCVPDQARHFDDVRAGAKATSMKIEELSDCLVTESSVAQLKRIKNCTDTPK
nr:hypothetical protein CFP56_26726 [Quercus suber]